ncbi:MAG: rRNA pseudouridine synthase [Desulfatitalea sp.]|nr:rRNA pseudouridine synthase [Desulfatitalea sp.]NNK02099.1 rRNA pseudouridine synthase [Desulfatitalea sp.]
MTLIRLQKWLSEAGVCSRRQGETYIQDGRVKVNGRRITLLGSKIDPTRDRVEVDGRSVAARTETLYVALHKPKGYVTSCRHDGQKVVLDLVDLPTRIFPIGRLDKDTTGLLLLTNDGPLHHQLSHPSFDHEKEYEVLLREPIDDAQLRQLAEGVRIDGRKTRPTQVKRLSGRRFCIILQEGRNRQIRRMVRRLGHHVKRLKRVRVAHIRLGNLPEGTWRFLTSAERKALLREATTKAPRK